MRLASETMNDIQTRSDQQECRHERYPRKQISASSRAPCLSEIDVAHEDGGSVRNAIGATPRKIPSHSRTVSWSQTAGTSNVTDSSGNIDIRRSIQADVPGSIPQRFSRPTHHPTNLSDRQDTWWLRCPVIFTIVYKRSVNNLPLCITTSAPHLNGS